MRKIQDKLALGAAAGLLATVPMTLFMVLAHRLLPAGERQPLPPRQVTMNVLEAAGVPARETLDEPAKRSAATLAAHFSYGAGAGAVYSLVAGKSKLHPAIEGAGFGLLVWAASYMGWLPLTGIADSPKRTSPRRNALMIAANALWGVATATGHRKLVRNLD